MPFKSQNTFENGLNQDVTPIKQPPGTYRDLWNGMLVSYDGNHYAVETVLGNTVNFTIPPRYSNNTFALDTPPLPIGFISFIDTLVVFSTNNSSSTGGYGEIGIVTFDNANQGTYVPIYHENNLKFTKQNKIFGFAYAESDKIEKVYWTDNLNEIRVLNTKDPLITTYVSSGSLLPLTQYMVLAGAIEYPVGSGQFFGPGLPNTNVFITDTTNTTYAVADGAPLVVQYLNYRLLSFTPDRMLGQIDFFKWITGGAVNYGSKMYFYRLSLKKEGFTTGWSYGSFPINVNNQSANTWKDVEGGGYGGLTASAKGIRVQISGIDTSYDTIEVAVAEFDEKNNVLTDAKIIAYTPVTGPTMTFDHLGNENIEELSVDDLTLFPASVLTCKDLCAAKNYITIGNLKEREEITFDTSSITIADTVYNTPADIYGGNLTTIQQGSLMCPSTGVVNGNIYPDGKYLVTGNGSVSYNGTPYASGSTFVGVPGVFNYAVTSGAPVILGCIIIQKYQNGVGNAVNKVIPLMDDFFDYKGMAATSYLRQYWTNEVYRFGILFYDLKGNPYFVRWIGDHAAWNPGNTVPPTGITNKGGLIKDNGHPHYALQINGIKVSGITIPPSLVPFISGFSIMRAPRDRQYYAQGVFFPTVNNGSGKIHPMAACQLGNDANYASYGGPSGVYTWHSPDALCNSSIFSGRASGDKFEGEAFLTPLFSTTTPVLQYSGGGQMSYTKYYINPTGLNANAPFDVTIQKYSVVPPNGTDQVIGLTFENQFLATAGLAPVSPGREAAGGNCCLVGSNIGINYKGSNITSQPSLEERPIANYKIAKGNLYGGQSTNAISNTPFISTGHFQEINSTVLAGLPLDGNGNYVFNEVEVYGGDSFVSIFDHGKALYNQNAGASGPYEYGIFFPVESNVNHSLRQTQRVLGGVKTLSRDGMVANNGSGGVYYLFGGTTQLESFQVNDAYTSDGDVIEYPALPDLFNVTNKFPYRVRWAGPKISGLSGDIFRNFLVNNYRDLDGQRGEINNLYSKQDKVYYWQNHGFGYLPILERQTVSGDLGEPTQLGVGGVIDRFDAYDTYFGNQHQASLVSTEFGFSWFDMRRRAWLIMNIAGGHDEISVAKGLQSYFNAAFDNQTFNGSIISTDKPLMGIGIHGVYDAKFKTTLLTFKDFVLPAFDQRDPYVNYDFTVGYNHVKNAIIGFFPGMNPAIWHQHNYQLVSAKNSNGKLIKFGTQYAVGDELPKNATEYCCVTGFITHNPVQPFEQPDAPGSLLWTKMYAENEVHLNWSGDVCSHYGKVYPHRLDIIVNPTSQDMFVVDNLQVKSSLDQNFDSITFTTDTDTATDSNLNGGTRYYRVRDAAWESNCPLGNKGRLIDFYTKISFNLRNYLKNPTVSKNLKKVTVFVNSICRIRR